LVALSAGSELVGRLSAAKLVQEKNVKNIAEKSILKFIVKKSEFK
jgi:hypothetical protein